jgi:hypothetical protein
MSTSSAKEALVLMAAVAAGLCAILVMQDRQDLNRRLGSWLEAGRQVIGQPGDDPAPPPLRPASAARPTGGAPVAASGAEASAAPRVAVPASSLAASAAVASSPSSLASAGMQGVDKGTTHAEQSKRLSEDVQALLHERDVGHWSNDGLMLWRTCVKLVRSAPRPGPSYELVASCNLLLDDAIRTLHAEMSAKNAPEIILVARELRAERTLASPAQLQELDKIVASARLLMPRLPASESATASASRSGPVKEAAQSEPRPAALAH